MQRERRPFVVAIAYEEGQAGAARGFGVGAKLDLPVLERKARAAVEPAAPPTVNVAKNEEPKLPAVAEPEKKIEVPKEAEKPALAEKTVEDPQPAPVEKVVEPVPVPQEEPRPAQPTESEKVPDPVKAEPSSPVVQEREPLPEPPTIVEEQKKSLPAREEVRANSTPAAKAVPVAVVPAVQQARSVWPFVCMGLGAAGLLVYGAWQRKASKSKARSLISQSLEK